MNKEKSAYSPDIHQIKLSDYTYELPEDRIAQQPLKQRDRSKLLMYRQGEISHHHFFQLPDLLLDENMLVFNDTKVIRARIFLRRKTGALIEILLLHPVQPQEVHLAMQVEQQCIWKCIIGRKKRWKAGETLEQQLEFSGYPVKLEIDWEDRENDLIRFSWNPPNISWAQWVEKMGQLPLPPYIQREVSQDDSLRYQTIYAEAEGAVAAPTAGLHFTDDVLQKMADKGILSEYLTLHVSAGTFMPVRHETVMDHDMHSEQFIITAENIDRFISHAGKIIAVGTTSMRVLESLYWLGADMIDDMDSYSTAKKIQVDTLMPYQMRDTAWPEPLESLKAIRNYMRVSNLDHLVGETSIFIMPGYSFKLCNGLITNFHMPGTTLLLLIAAFIGEDWKKVYEEAMNGEYRFLSYGDSSLLLP